jgi:hypothetical protein
MRMTQHSQSHGLQRIRGPPIHRVQARDRGGACWTDPADRGAAAPDAVRAGEIKLAHLGDGEFRGISSGIVAW